jgi:transcriptional regulator with XRE-family HTH domain
MKSFFDSIKNESKANEKIFARATLIQNVTEDIMVAMDDLKISKSELARKIGKSKSYITQILSGSRNMTLTSLSDLCFELNITPDIRIIEDNQKLEVSEANLKHHSFSWHKTDLKSYNLSTVRKTTVKAISIGSHPEYKYKKEAA